MVSQRVYWLIFLRPSSPPFFAISSSCGITTVISCMMIEALMYGVMPIAMMESFCSAPPERKPSRL